MSNSEINKAIKSNNWVLLEELIRTYSGKMLILSYNNLHDPGMVAIAKGLKYNTTLARLHLHGDIITSISAIEFAEALQVNTKLKHLTLNTCEIGDKEISILFDGLKVNSTLTTLDLSNNNIGYIGIKSLVEALKYNSTLLILDISYNHIGDDGAKIIGNYLTLLTFKSNLKSTLKVKELNLSNNNIGNIGLNSIVEGLMNNPTLLLLDLSSNQINDNGAESIALLLKSNSTLSSLYLMYNDIRNDGIITIINGFKYNKSLEHLGISYQNIDRLQDLQYEIRMLGTKNIHNKKVRALSLTQISYDILNNLPDVNYFINI